MGMPTAPTLPPFDPDGLDRGDADLDASASAPSAAEPRWLGYRPRTLVILGAVVAILVLAEAQWLYSPFRSGSPSAGVGTETADPADPTATDPTDPGAADPTATDPAAPAPYRTKSRVTIRTSPSSASVALGHVAVGTTVTVTCVATGEAVTTAQGTNDRWDQVTIDTTTGYLTDSLVTPMPGSPTPDQLPSC